MSIAANRPTLMVGVPTGYLSPQLPFPKNAESHVSVGVEIAPGLGIGLDGKTLLVGASQGLSVYLDGVRVNEAFGDIVNWDLIPEFSLADLTLVPGANPAFGLNTIGGALALTTLDGLSAPGWRANAGFGSFGRIYLVAAAGTTGLQTNMNADVDAYLQRIKDLELRNSTLVGFGISDAASFRAASRHTTGAIIGSAFIRLLQSTPAEQRAAAIREFVAGVRPLQVA